LSQAVLAGSEQLGGLWGVRILTALLAWAGGLLIWANARLWGRSRLEAAFLVASIAPALAFLIEPRPHLFSFVFLGAFLWIVHRPQAPSWRGVVLAAVLTLFWINFHAVGLLAPLLAGGSFLESLPHRREPGEAPVRRLVLAVLCALATLGTPSGTDLYRYAIRGAGVSAIMIDEWQPFWFRHPPVSWVGWPASIGALLAGGFAIRALVRAARRRDPRNTLIASGAALLVFKARRWLWLGFLPVAGGLPRGPWKKNGRRALLAGTVILAALPILHPRIRKEFQREEWAHGGASPSIQPVEAVRFLKALDLGGNLYNTYSWGGYVVHELQPAWKCFLYGETELFAKTGVLAERQHVELGPPSEALAILDRRRVRALLVPRLGRDGRPSRPPGGDGPDGVWIRAFANRHAVVWLRRNDEEAIAAARGYYRARHVPWNETLGFLEHNALLGNLTWARQSEQLYPQSFPAVEPLVRALKADPADPRARALFARALHLAHFERSARAFEAQGR